MISVTYRELLEAGAHFGHRVSRWHPGMRPYLFGKRNGIHILDIRETLKGLIRANHAILKLVGSGGDIVFVGTKRQARPLVEAAAKRCGMPYVVDRWLGGTLTNFETIKLRVRHLEELEAMERDGAFLHTNKKVLATMMRDKRKMLRNLQGLRIMKQMPAGIILIDPKREDNCVREAQRLGVVTVALLDTDCDPGQIDFCVPANDDSIKSISIFLRVVSDAVLEGRRLAGRDLEPTAAELGLVAAPAGETGALEASGA